MTDYLPTFVRPLSWWIGSSDRNCPMNELLLAELMRSNKMIGWGEGEPAELSTTGRHRRVRIGPGRGLDQKERSVNANHSYG